MKDGFWKNPRNGRLFDFMWQIQVGTLEFVLQRVADLLSWPVNTKPNDGIQYHLHCKSLIGFV